MMEEELLKFDRNGYLQPYDVVSVSWLMFAQTFGQGVHRGQLLTDYELFLSTLRNVLQVNHRQWVDGSFISEQEQPGDIDVIIFVPYTEFGGVLDRLKRLKEEWIGRIDCYFVEAFPADHKKYEISRADELDWYHFLRTDRKKRPKGIIELQFDYGDQ
ncbi:MULTISPECIES: hypothetical protein [Spirosoma]|uniref:DUF6932 family protein n=1 Tax=Spirosoma TaxID=107 RepID=UPI000963413D|nr:MULTISPECIES: hypothetical protein [Spirosoma]MBN8822119.1 hypothetical protein [Spirosoma sp.]OJW80517.1 MAG: hypothetical protein BGO59_34125 [Spirosoma sp. 48-14]